MSRPPTSLFRKLVLAGGTVVLLASGAILVVTLATSTGPGPSPAPDAPEAPVAAPAPAEVPDAGHMPPPALPKVTATGLPSPPSGGPSAPPPTDPLPPEPSSGSWEVVPPDAPTSTLEAVERELLDLQPSLSACFDEVSLAHLGQPAVAETQDAALGEEGGFTVLMLAIEASDDEVRIVDASVESRGDASDGLIACAQRVLRGRRIAAPGARPGQRFRLMHSLTE